MKMIKLYISTLALLMISCFAEGQIWYEQKVLDIAIVSFPQKPSHHDTLSHHFYKYLTDSATFYVQVGQVPEHSFDLTDKEVLKEYYEGVAEGVVKGMNGKIVSRENLTINGLGAMQIEFTTTDGTNLPSLGFMQLIAIGNSILSQGYLTDTTLKIATEPDRKYFFESLEVTKVGVERNYKANENKSSAYKLGYLGAQLAMALLLGAFIYFIVKRATRKS